VKHNLGGTFEGEVPYAGSSEPYALSELVDVNEPAQNVWIPLIGPEVRIGYRLSKRFVVDLGVAGFLFLGPSSKRSGGSHDDERRDTPLSDVRLSDGTVQPGFMNFEEEESLGTFFGIVPTLGLRVDF
jgi:hypothetical protein